MRFEPQRSVRTAPRILHILAIVCVVSVLLAERGLAEIGPVPATRVLLDGEPIAVRSWLVAGMFPSEDLPDPPREGPSRSGYDTDYLLSLGGEAKARPQAGTQVPVPGERPVVFVGHEWDSSYLDLTDLFGNPRDVCGYLFTELESEAAQDVFLHVGTNDAGKVWLGGELILSCPQDRMAKPSQEVVGITLKAGRTPLLLKVDQAGGDYQKAFARIKAASWHKVSPKSAPKGATNDDGGTEPPGFGYWLKAGFAATLPVSVIMTGCFPFSFY